MASENEYLHEIEDTLIHWCDARKNLSEKEKAENTRCAMDLIDVLARTGRGNVVRLKRAYPLSVKHFVDELRAWG